MASTNPFSIDFTTIAPVPFSALLGKPTEAEAEPTPKNETRRAFLSRINRRRFECLQKAEEALDKLPEDGESIHGLMTGFYDCMHLIVVILRRLKVHCDSLRLSTLSMSRRNTAELCTLLDSGKVGTIDIIVSDVFSRKDSDIFAELSSEFAARGQRVGVVRSHAKLVCIGLADKRKYVMETSANLRSNRNIEQYAFTQDGALFDYYDSWIREMVVSHAVTQS